MVTNFNDSSKNYEVEVDELLMKALTTKYNMSEKNVYLYLSIKHKLILNSGFKLLGINDYWQETMIQLIKDELRMKDLIFNEIQMKSYSFTNNYCNILESWKALHETPVVLSFKQDSLNDEVELNNTGSTIYNKCWNALCGTQAVLNFKQYSFDVAVDNTCDIIYENTLKQSKKYKDKTIDLYLELRELDVLFDVPKNTKVCKMDGFTYNDFEGYISINDKVSRSFFNKAFFGSSVGNLSEADIEQYFYKNLDKIEKGLRPVSRQFKIKDGFIDILAKDEDGKYVIIELKIKNDKSLVWQVLYYPKALKEVLGNVKCRVITLAPTYNDSVREVLQDLDVEILKYKVQIRDNHITDSLVINI